jgi:hypothetical protein
VNFFENGKGQYFFTIVSFVSNIKYERRSLERMLTHVRPLL